MAIRVLDAADDFAAGLYQEPQPFIPAHDAALFQTASDEDRLLAETCLAAERDLRRREWSAVEALLAAIPPGGDLEDVYGLPAAQVCGWLSEAGA